MHSWCAEDRWILSRCHGPPRDIEAVVKPSRNINGARYTPNWMAKSSKAKWHHVRVNAHYTFRGSGQIVDLDAIVAGLDMR